MSDQFRITRLMSVALLTCSVAAPISAQETTTAPVVVVETADCEAQFLALDVDANGVLTEAEAGQVFARSRIDNVTIAETGYTKDDYMASCGQGVYARAAPEAGAPFEGANSFTQGQAQDRAIAWGVTGVSELTKDDTGIWRGTGQLDGASVAVAVDYKGNVVTAAQ